MYIPLGVIIVLIIIYYYQRAGLEDKISNLESRASELERRRLHEYGADDDFDDDFDEGLDDDGI
jgi:hypothetical protein